MDKSAEIPDGRAANSEVIGLTMLSFEALLIRKADFQATGAGSLKTKR